ncbi:MAG TPA: hypothetical protein VMF89_06150, partial [Polyangiales bacterium]|nr:hypothetical protein [Polyangiales bacterium]
MRASPSAQLRAPGSLHSDASCALTMLGAALAVTVGKVALVSGGSVLFWTAEIGVHDAITLT